MSVVDAMRADWNRRAEEDANYYVAFGRRSQTEDEFFATASDVVRALETELKRRTLEYWASSRAIEIGCGPGRLMRFVQRHFAEVHGVDISDEMVRRARENLRDYPNAYPQHAPHSDLSAFASGSFHFVYSYAVFQHIPSRAVVLGYLREADRVLAPGGLFVFQINGLEAKGHIANTWNGARFAAGEMFAFARQQNLQLLALNGQDTQYMWVTLQKRREFTTPFVDQPVITGVTSADTGEAAIPNGGRFGAVSVWLENLPETEDLLSLSTRIDGQPAVGCFLGAGRKRQFNSMVPPGVRTGLVPIEVLSDGARLCAPSWARIVPQGPRVPRIVSITDGTNLTSSRQIETGYGKLTIEDVIHPSEVSIRIDGVPAEEIDYFRVDPLTELYEFNFRVPRETLPGTRKLEVSLGRRRFAPITLEIL